MSRNKAMRDSAALKHAFLQGAKFWEFHTSGGTMWQSDQRLCIIKAEEMEEDGTLGVERAPRLTSCYIPKKRSST
jgi:hypothetical protein